MVELKKIRDRIREIADRPKNVRLSDIEWVVNRLAQNGYSTRAARNEHQVLFTVQNVKFSVCTHHGGGSQVKPVYVKSFLSAMIDLGLYED